MNQHEQQLILELAEKLQNSPAPAIDREADDLIRRTIGTRPDVLYILTQAVLVQDMALKQAQARIQQMEQGAGAPGFLPQQGAAQSGYAQQPPPPPQYQQPGYYQDQPRNGFSNFLHNAAQTAAGVMAGELAFDALGSLFGGRGGFFGGGQRIVNNYYDEPGAGGAAFSDAGGDSRFAQVAEDSGQGISSDIEDDRFADSGGFDSGDGGGFDGGGDSF